MPTIANPVAKPAQPRLAQPELADPTRDSDSARSRKLFAKFVASRTPKPKETCLGDIVDEVGTHLTKDFSAHMVITQRWQDIAGDHADICQPGKLDGSCLHVLAQSTRHASVIRWETKPMLERIAAHLPEGEITEIKVLAHL